MGKKKNPHVYRSKPPPTPAHRSSGVGPMGSGGAANSIIVLAIALVAIPTLAIVSAFGYVVLS